MNNNQNPGKENFTGLNNLNPEDSIDTVKSESKAYKLATSFLEKENAKILKEEAKRQERINKANVKIEKRKVKSETRAKRLLEADLSEMTTQQKIVVLTRLFFFAGMPFFMYMIIPAIVIALGTAFASKDLSNLADRFSSSLTNYYSFMGILFALIYLFVSARRRGTKVSEDITLTFKGINFNYLMLMFVFGFCSSFMISSVYSLLPDWLMASYDSSTLDVYNTYDVALLLISLTILDPIAEEIIFRGYMLNRLLPVIKEKASIWIVTIVFAICHLSPFWIIYGLALGWVLAKISIRHDNILYSIAIHMGFNFPTLLIFIISNNQKLNDLLFGNKLLFIVYSLVSLTGVVYLLWYYNKVENIGIKFNFLKNK